jgi:hypothetical protein
VFAPSLVLLLLAPHLALCCSCLLFILDYCRSLLVFLLIVGHLALLLFTFHLGYCCSLFGLVIVASYLPWLLLFIACLILLLLFITCLILLLLALGCYCITLHCLCLFFALHCCCLFRYSSHLPSCCCCSFFALCYYCLLFALYLLGCCILPLFCHVQVGAWNVGFKKKKHWFFLNLFLFNSFVVLFWCF